MKSKIYTAFILLCLSITGGCSDDAAKPRHKASHLVEVVSVKRQPLTAERHITGSLEALRTIQVYNEEQGKITAINFYPGDNAKTGDVLVELDDRRVQAEFDKAKAAYKQAQLDYRRVKKLRKRKLASDNEIARAATAVEQARAEQQLQATRLKNSRATAPFAGIISERLKEPGDVVPLHSHILTYFDPTTLIVKLNVSEIIIANIEQGQQVQLRVDALGDKSFNGIVSRKYPTIDPITRQGIIEVTLEPVPEGAMPGQLVRAKITGSTLPLRSIPFTVVRHDTRGEFVYLIKNNKAVYTQIRTGAQLGTAIEVIDGLNDGDMVVSKGFLGIRDGNKVNITKADGMAVNDKPDKIGTTKHQSDNNKL